MLLIEHREELKGLLRSYLTKAINEIAESSADAYSFIVYAASGFADIGVAYSTRESLAKLIDKASRREHVHPYCSADAYYELNAWEWEHFCVESFTEVISLLDENYDDFYEAGITNEQIWQFFEDLLIEVVSDLKADGAFSHRRFEKDILLGIQFPDPSGSEIDIMERASKALNSPYWHERYRANCMALRPAPG